MIGQKNLIKAIDNFQELPHSLLLVGERGSEEELVTEYIAKKFNLIAFDLTSLITKDFIDQIYESHTRSLYVVNLLKITPAQQSILLKFFEEPTPYSYILLFTENESLVLDTILTRAYKLKMDCYTIEDLRTYNSSLDNLSYKICRTPGQADLLAHTDVQKLHGLCTAIVESMSKASYTNTLSISEKLNYSDEYSKYDLYLFLKMLRLVLLEKANLNLYKKILDVDKVIWQMNNKKLQIEYLLTVMWCECSCLQI